MQDSGMTGALVKHQRHEFCGADVGRVRGGVVVSYFTIVYILVYVTD